MGSDRAIKRRIALTRMAPQKSVKYNDGEMGNYSPFILLVI